MGTLTWTVSSQQRAQYVLYKTTEMNALSGGPFVNMFRVRNSFTDVKSCIGGEDAEQTVANFIFMCDDLLLETQSKVGYISKVFEKYYHRYKPH
jgi:hypothetical protein